MTSSRRQFLKAAALAPSLQTAPKSVAPRSAVKNSSFDPWVEVDASHFRHNVAEIHRRNGGRPILAVIKNNGYGAGVANVARILEPLAPIAGFAVVKLQEAIALRDGGISKPILLMGPFDPRELDDIVARRVMPMVYMPVGDA